MKKQLVVVVSLALLVLLGLGVWYYRERLLKTALVDLQAHRREWADEVKVATVTSRIALGDRIVALQKLTRRLDSMQPPDALTVAYKLERDSEDTTIRGTLAFMEQDPQAGDLLKTAAELSKKEAIELLPLRRRFFPEEVAAEEAIEEERKQQEQKIAEEQLAAERREHDRIAAEKEAQRRQQEEVQQAARKEELQVAARQEEVQKAIRKEEAERIAQAEHDHQAYLRKKEVEEAEQAKLQAAFDARLQAWRQDHRQRFSPLARAISTEAEAFAKGEDLYPGCKPLADALATYERGPANTWPPELRLQHDRLLLGVHAAVESCPVNNRYKMGQSLAVIREAVIVLQ